MKTKIVYVLVSSENDIYFEQAWLSAWSLKHYNSAAKIIMLTDSNTIEIANRTKRKNALTLFDEIKTCDFNNNTNNKIRSRWLKTNMRNLVQGDFLFIDSDTIITDELTEIDNFQSNLGLVFDLNRRLKECFQSDKIKSNIKTIFNINVPDNFDYYNSGVMYVKDVQDNYVFFDKWHKNWQYSLQKTGKVLDQPPLFKTDVDMGGIIKPIDGIYNCQILSSIKYLHSAKIIHFFNVIKNDISPFYNVALYEEIKKNGIISNSLQTLVKNCKEDIVTNCVPVKCDLWNILNCSAIDALNLFKEKYNRIFRFINKFSNFILRYI